MLKAHTRTQFSDFLSLQPPFFMLTHTGRLSQVLSLCVSLLLATRGLQEHSCYILMSVEIQDNTAVNSYVQ